MSAITDFQNSLPYPDASYLTPTDLKAAKALVEAESSLSTSPITSISDASNLPALPLHPDISTEYSPKFSQLIEAEHVRITRGRKLEGGINLSRYEEVSPPSNTTSTLDKDIPRVLETWHTALRKAYTNSTYLSGRLANLRLLEQHGKNGWLMGNALLENILKDLEKELAGIKAQVEGVEAARRVEQENVSGEIIGLEEGWRQSISKMIETEAAAESLRQQILKLRHPEQVHRSEPLGTP